MAVNDRRVESTRVPYAPITVMDFRGTQELLFEALVDTGYTAFVVVPRGGGTPAVNEGKYLWLYTRSEGTWKLIINKQTGQWGTNYDEQQDLARIDMQKSQTEQPVEQFTISFKKKSDNAADLVMEWENLRLTVPVKLQ